MSVPFTLSLTSGQHATIKEILLKGKSKPSIAIAFCGQRAGNRRHKLMVRSIHQSSFPVTKGSLRAISGENIGMAVAVFMCANDFSLFCGNSDSKILYSIEKSLETRGPFASATMLPDGQLSGNVLLADGSVAPFEVISVVGDDIQYWYAKNNNSSPNDFCASHTQLFGAGTIERLSKLSIAVVGCSGTGSPLIEQLMRLGVGELVLVDYDPVEERNLNRIYNSTLKDAQQGRLKVDILAEAIRRTGLGTSVIPIPQNLWSIEAVHAVAQSDIIFGCMDGADGRYLLNVLATYHTIPYFDLGVRLEAEPGGVNKGRINEVCGGVHYLQPGQSSLISRRVISMRKVMEDGLRRKDPSAHAQECRDGYISGVVEHRPAVVSVNTLAASIAVNEMLARIHPYREEENHNFAQVFFSLSSMEIISDPEGPTCSILWDKVGLGDTNPLLGEMELSIMDEKK